MGAMAALGHKERVEGIAMARGVDFRVQDAQAAVVEIPAREGEQVLLVPRIQQHLDAFAGRRQARAHGRPLASHMHQQRAGVPRDVLRRVTQEVNDIQFAPQRFVRPLRKPVQPQDAQRLLLASLQLGIGRAGLSAQCAPRQLEQRFDQARLPAVPYLGAGSANIGHGQQIQGDQAPVGAHQPGEPIDHCRIGQILLLRHLRHRQMMAHREHDQLLVFGGDAVLAAESTRIAGSLLAVVCPAPLGDVME